MATLKAECKECGWRGSSKYIEGNDSSRHIARNLLAQKHHMLNPECKTASGEQEAVG